MKKLVGYAIAVAGLAVIAVAVSPIQLPLLKQFSSSVLNVIGGAAVVVGVILAKRGHSKHQQVSEEVPIYEGEGKDRKIVGYRRN